MKYLIYCTKAKPLIYFVDNEVGCVEKINGEFAFRTNKNPSAFNGKIIAEFECDNVERFEFNTMSREIFSYWYENGHEVDYDKMCLTYEELWDYLGDSIGYALHINNLKTFDEPLELNSPLLRPNKKCKDCKKMINVSCCIKKALEPNTLCNRYYGVKAPSNMQMVWHNGELKVLIPCSSKECANLFNGNATILVRNKILKGMI